MVTALTLDGLYSKISSRYDHDEQRVVGIMLARYDIHISEEIINQSYLYWHLNSKKFFDVYWAGYGEYLPASDESATKKILTFPGNTSNAYFDLEAFIEIKEQFNEYFDSTYDDTLQLILVNYRDGRLQFNESIRIDLEENLDRDYATIRKIMEFITRECRSAHEITPIVRKLKLGKLKDVIKGITISDAISTVLGIASL